MIEVQTFKKLSEWEAEGGGAGAGGPMGASGAPGGGRGPGAGGGGGGLSGCVEVLRAATPAPAGELARAAEGAAEGAAGLFEAAAAASAGESASLDRAAACGAVVAADVSADALAAVDAADAVASAMRRACEDAAATGGAGAPGPSELREAGPAGSLGRAARGFAQMARRADQLVRQRMHESHVRGMRPNLALSKALQALVNLRQAAGRAPAFASAAEAGGADLPALALFLAESLAEFARGEPPTAAEDAHNMARTLTFRAQHLQRIGGAALAGPKGDAAWARILQALVILAGLADGAEASFGRDLSRGAVSPLAAVVLDALAAPDGRRRCESLPAHLREAAASTGGEDPLGGGAALALLKAATHRWGLLAEPAPAGMEEATSASVAATLVCVADMPSLSPEAAVTAAIGALLAPRTRRGSWRGLLGVLCTPHTGREQLCAEILANVAQGGARQGSRGLASLPAEVVFRLLELALEQQAEELLGALPGASDSSSARANFFKPRAAPVSAVPHQAAPVGLAVAEQLARVAGEALLAADDSRGARAGGVSSRMAFLEARLSALAGPVPPPLAEGLATALLLREHGPTCRPALQASQPWTEPLLRRTIAGIARDAPPDAAFLQDLWVAEALARHADAHLPPKRTQALARAAVGAMALLGPASRRPGALLVMLRAAAAAVVAGLGDTLAPEEARRALRNMASWQAQGRVLPAVAQAVGVVGGADLAASRDIFRSLFTSRDCIAQFEGYEALKKLMHGANATSDFRSYVPKDVFDASKLGGRQAELHPFFQNMKVHMNEAPATAGPGEPDQGRDLLEISSQSGCLAARARISSVLDAWVPRPTAEEPAAGARGARPEGPAPERKRGGDENEAPGVGPPPNKKQRHANAAAVKAAQALEDLCAALTSAEPAERGGVGARAQVEALEAWLRKIRALVPPANNVIQL